MLSYYNFKTIMAQYSTATTPWLQLVEMILRDKYTVSLQKRAKPKVDLKYRNEDNDSNKELYGEIVSERVGILLIKR